MGSVFDRFRQPSGQNNFMNILKDYQKIKQNPSEIGEMLLKVGKIDQNQYENIKKLNNPTEIGEYLLNNNKDFQKMYNGK